jgi:hypothetical protein
VKNTVLLNSDGSPWNHGTLYLLSKLELTNPLSPKTLDSIAIDLVNFKNFIDIQELNYTEIPKRKFNRPTYQYRAHLQDLISSGHVSSSTASRRMSSIINFYRWLAKQHDCHFEYSPWSEKDMYIRFSDHAGFTQMKKIKTTDLKVNVQRQGESCRKHIQDGGKLRPLDKAEQERILKALVSINSNCSNHRSKDSNCLYPQKKGFPYRSERQGAFIYAKSGPGNGNRHKV